jgi:pimeloyl-ACP methyl ester carboxylesterase
MGSRALSRVFAVAGPAVAAALVTWGLARRAERRTPPIGRFVEAHGVRLHWIERGSGPPLIALHGDGSLLQEVAISGLVDRLGSDFRVILLDRPGYGYSERPGRGWTPRAQADLIAAFMDKLGVAEAVILGHSWGTLVALALAVDHPHRVTRLVLMSGYFYPVPRLDAALLSPVALPVIGDVVRWTVAPALTRLAFPFLVANCFAPLPVPERFHRAFPKGLALRPSHLRAAAEDTAYLQSGAADLSRHYAALRCSITIISGGSDQVVDVHDHSRRLHREIASSELVVVPGVGHMVHHSALNQVVEAIRANPGTDA